MFVEIDFEYIFIFSRKVNTFQKLTTLRMFNFIHEQHFSWIWIRFCSIAMKTFFKSFLVKSASNLSSLEKCFERFRSSIEKFIVKEMCAVFIKILIVECGNQIFHSFSRSTWGTLLLKMPVTCSQNQRNIFLKVCALMLSFKTENRRDIAEENSVINHVASTLTFYFPLVPWR